MRANLKCFLARLALASFATLGFSVTTFAHDLPEVKAFARAHSARTTAAGTVVSTTQPSDLLTVARPDVGDAPRPVASHAKSEKQFAVVRPDAGDAPRPIASHVQPDHLLTIARPAVGSAPRPVVKLAQAAPQSPSQAATAKANSARANEVYMPYDFQLSDWRFGQFPYHARSASALSPVSLPTFAQDLVDVPQLARAASDRSAAAHTGKDIEAPAAKAVVKLGPPSPQAVALGNFLQRLDQWQCTAYSVVTDANALARSAERLSKSLAQLAINYRPTLLPANALPARAPNAASVAPSIKQTSPLVGPKFVVYDAALGGHIVLTVDQAHDWQFETTAPGLPIQDALATAVKPIRSSVLAHASRQLELAGHGLLSLSRNLSSFASASPAGTKVASLPNRKD